MEVIRELAARISMQVDQGSLVRADAALGRFKDKMGRLHEANGRFVAGSRSAAAAVNGVASSAGAASGALGGMVLKYVSVAATAVAAKHAFIDFNSRVEQSVISLAAVQQMFKGGEWGGNMKVAKELLVHYQEVAKASVGTTEDFINMHKAVAASAYQAGATLEDVKEISKGAVIAASAMGESAYISAMDIKQALTKGVEIRDRFMIQMLASQKISKETFNAMSKAQRVETMKKLLTAGWIKDAAAQMEVSFEGVTSTLKDNLSISLGKVGLPLFQRITQEIKSWNEWIAKNPREWNVLMGKVRTVLDGMTMTLQGVAAVVKVAFKPVMAFVDIMQELEDKGRYNAGLFSERGLREAQAQGPEATDEYIRTKAYGHKPSRPAAPLPGGKVNRMADKMGSTGAGLLGLFDRWNRGDELFPEKSITQKAQDEHFDKWSDDFKRLRGRAPTEAEYRQEKENYWIEKRDLGRRMREAHTGRAESLPSMPGMGVSTYDLNAPPPPMLSPWAPPTPPPTKLTGDVSIKVRVDVPNMDAQVEKSLQSIWREGNELVSREP